MAAADQDSLLRALAVMIVHRPRANLHELANAVGVSKATLYRFAGTRDQLVDKVRCHCVDLLRVLIEEAKLDEDHPHVALGRLIDKFVEHREFINFVLHHGRDDGNEAKDTWKPHQELLDVFFLRGQKSRAFRLDVPASYLCECFSALISGFAEADRNGRVARASMREIIEKVMLTGIAGREQDQVES